MSKGDSRKTLILLGRLEYLLPAEEEPVLALWKRRARPLLLDKEPRYAKGYPLQISRSASSQSDSGFSGLRFNCNAHEIVQYREGISSERTYVNISQDQCVLINERVIAERQQDREV